MSKARFVFSAMVFALAGMVVVFVAVGCLLADHWHVETSRTIRTQPDRLRALVGDLATWSQWTSMEVSLGPQTRRTVVGQAGHVGHGLQWSGSLGAATLTMTSFADDAVEYEYHGDGPDHTPLPWRATGRIEWHLQDGACVVRWQENGQLDTLPGRWFSWFGATQAQVRQIQVTSLEGLAEAVERAAK